MQVGGSGGWIAVVNGSRYKDFMSMKVMYMG